MAWLWKQISGRFYRYFKVINGSEGKKPSEMENQENELCEERLVKWAWASMQGYHWNDLQGLARLGVAAAETFSKLDIFLSETGFDTWTLWHIFVSRIMFLFWSKKTPEIYLSEWFRNMDILFFLKYQFWQFLLLPPVFEMYILCVKGSIQLQLSLTKRKMMRNYEWWIFILYMV